MGLSRKKLSCHHDNNCCYFSKLDIPVITLVVGSRDVIKLSKNMSLSKVSQTARVVFNKCRKFLSVFIVYEWGRISESAIDK